LRWLLAGDSLATIVDFLVLVAAIKIYFELRKTSPYNRFSLSVNGLRDWKKAIAPLETGLKIHPNNFLLNKRIALYYLYCGAYPKALPHLQKCLNLKHSAYSVSLFFPQPLENQLEDYLSIGYCLRAPGLVRRIKHL